ncbi:hypothetical protein NEPAR06_0909 [Nematocida parisii]|uniref:Uncharacterized protein n=1 Tax=Nematocida parisii (strain ERTm3) TaxID=935791 RepID=I3EDT9_NEMP3|nr:hypothetical protein NEQG_02509 [Nematocida parisii ERTm3]KAI5127558.1 hypothetical protein NEPAR08_0928 [Nematocida parisii]KAI5127833.1 hypothetical protein NEPAR03_1113 [Nematocida parisii]KAI5141651.1 hypothetical protein NEPAR04_1128 [Nematocida parisii]KAI5145508.1 hypothetical protein NEPAR07_1738 [Nematocida parisii]
MPNTQLNRGLKYLKNTILWIVCTKYMEVTQIMLLPTIFMYTTEWQSSVCIAAFCSLLLLFPCGLLEIALLVSLLASHFNEILEYTELVYNDYVWVSIGTYLAFAATVAIFSFFFSISIIKPVKFILKGKYNVPPVEQSSETPKFVSVEIPPSSDSLDSRKVSPTTVHKSLSEIKKAAKTAATLDSQLTKSLSTNTLENKQGLPSALLINYNGSPNAIELEVCIDKRHDIHKKKSKYFALASRQDEHINYLSKTWRGISFRYIRMFFLLLIFLVKAISICILYYIILNPVTDYLFILGYGLFGFLLLLTNLEVGFYSIDMPQKNYTHLFTLLLVYIILFGTFKNGEVESNILECKSNYTLFTFNPVEIVCSIKSMFPISPKILASF